MHSCGIFVWTTQGLGVQSNFFVWKRMSFSGICVKGQNSVWRPKEMFIVWDVAAELVAILLELLDTFLILFCHLWIQCNNFYASIWWQGNSIVNQEIPG